MASHLHLASSAVKRSPGELASADTYHFKDRKRGKVCLDGLQALYEQRTLCDVTLVVQGQEFPCHKVVLASSSPYFHAMFTSNFVERSSERIRINEIEVSCLQYVFDYLYKGEVVISSHNVQQLFNAAHMLQLEPLEDACCCYMAKHITETNCIGVYFFAQAYKRQTLLCAARSKICRKFSKVTKGMEFLQLSPPEAAEILSFTGIQCLTEIEVYIAAQQWLEHNIATRYSHVYDIMKSVRFALLDENFFRQRVKNKPLFRSTRELTMMFDQVIYYMNHPNRWHELELVIEPRLGGRQHFTRPVIYTGQSHRYQNDTFLTVDTYDRGINDFYALCAFPDTAANPMLAAMTGSCELYAAGGSGSPSKAVYKTNRAMQYTKVASMNHGRRHFSFVHVDRFLYAVGGVHKGNHLDGVEKYNSDRNQWTKVAALPCRLRCTCAVSYRGRLFVFGGETALKKNTRREISNRAFCYDPETDRWQCLKPMPTARALAGCAVFRNRIYVVGGFCELSDSWVKHERPEVSLDTVEVYDPLGDTWSTGPSLPKPLCAMGVIKYYATVFVMGGISNQHPSFDVFYLNETGSTWVRDRETLNTYTEPTVHSCYVPVNVRIPYETSDTESETTCEISAFNELDIQQSDSSSSSSTDMTSAAWESGLDSSSSSDAGGYV